VPIDIDVCRKTAIGEASIGTDPVGCALGSTRETAERTRRLLKTITTRRKGVSFMFAIVFYYTLMILYSSMES